jgi:hypothetical protein
LPNLGVGYGERLLEEVYRARILVREVLTGQEYRGGSGQDLSAAGEDTYSVEGGSERVHTGH